MSESGCITVVRNESTVNSGPLSQHSVPALNTQQIYCTLYVVAIRSPKPKVDLKVLTRADSELLTLGIGLF